MNDGDGAAGRPLHGYAIQYLPRPNRRGVSRRTVVLAGGAAVVAAAGGVALGLTGAGGSTDAKAAPTPAPKPALPASLDELADAVDAERALLAGTQAALRTASGSQRAALQAVLADHRQHLDALRAAMRSVAYPLSVPVRLGTGAVEPLSGKAAESNASRAAARRALRLSGAPAALLASISASEASHAELLT